MFQSSRRVFLTATAALAACAHRSETPVYWEHHMISAGPNRPDFNVEAAINTQTLVALHQGGTLPEGAPLEELTARGFVKQGARGPVPAVLVAGLNDGRRWFAVTERVCAAGADVVRAHAPRAREAIGSIPGLARLDWAHASFFVLSDVLLDSWQINTVERRWLGAERPQRSGGRYYYSLMARPDASDVEAFGIYGNQFFNFGDVAIGLYGNRRLSARLLATLDAEALRALFVIDGELRTARADLARRLAAATRGQPLSDQDRAGFAALGLVDDTGSVIAPVLTEADYFALNNVAALAADDLIAVLAAAREGLAETYTASPYAETVSFEEYLIWWFHFFYTAVTDRLARDGVLRLPASGVATYIVTE